MSPFAALDEITRDRINEELLRLREEQNWTALFVTHSVAEAVFLSTRILILAPNPGRIAKDIPIDLPFPSQLKPPRRSEAFDRTIAEVSRALEAAVAGEEKIAYPATEIAQSAGVAPV